MYPVDRVNHISLSDDGSLLSIEGLNGVAVYSTETHEQQWMQSIEGTVYGAFGNGSQYLVLVEDYGLVIIIDSQTGSVHQAIDLNPGRSPTSARLNPQGDLLAVGMWGGPVVVWDVDRQKRVHLWTEPYERRQAGGQNVMVDWSSDGRLLAAGGWDNEVLIWDVETGELVHEFYNDFTVSNIDLSPDDAYVAAISWREGRATIWDIESDRLHRELQVPRLTPEIDGEALGGPILGISWSPNGDFLAGATDDGPVVIWETTNYTVVNTLVAEWHKLNSQAVHSIQWSPEASVLYTGSYDDKVVIWDVEAEEIIQTLSDTDLP